MPPWCGAAASMHPPLAASTIAATDSGYGDRHAIGTVDSNPSATPSALGFPQEGSPPRTGITT